MITMPTYQYKCDCGKNFDKFLKFSEWTSESLCECGKTANQIILAAPMAIISPDICYDSPIDGKPITNAKARREDLARSGCIPYDPEIKKQQKERHEKEDREIEKAIDETVECEIEKMPAVKKERLVNELESGANINIIRS